MPNIGDLAESSGLPFAEYGDPDYPHGYCYREEPLSDALWEAHGNCYCELCAGRANGSVSVALFAWARPRTWRPRFVTLTQPKRPGRWPWWGYVLVAPLDRETRNAVARVRARLRKSERLRIVMRMTTSRRATSRRAASRRAASRRAATSRRAERELVVLQSMGPDLASVYLLERGVL